LPENQTDHASVPADKCFRPVGSGDHDPRPAADLVEPALFQLHWGRPEESAPGGEAKQLRVPTLDFHLVAVDDTGHLGQELLPRLELAATEAGRNKMSSS
jgi:hypothetical protein